MKRNVVILLLLVFTVLISVESEEVSFDGKWKECLEGKDYDHKMVFAYYSEHEYRLIKVSHHAVQYLSKRSLQLSQKDQRFLSLCVCRSNYDSLTFLISPYAVTRNDSDIVEFHDAIILCLLGSDKYESIGIYDENELFDALLLKRNEAVSNSIINPFGVGEYEGHNGSETYCYDFYGYPTKNVLGQRTCLLAVEMSQEKNYIYSGPLMGKAMIMDSMAFCYSFVNGSFLYGEDYCLTSISLKSVKFQCCCAHEPHFCSPKGLTTNVNEIKQLYCFFGEIEIIESGNYTNDVDQQNFTLTDYFYKSVKSYCTMTVSAGYFSHKGDYFVQVTYGAQDRCINEITYEIYYIGYCASKPGFPNYIEMTKCCKDGHFCNQKWNLKNIQLLNCQYKPEWAAYLSEGAKCELFFDIWLNKSVAAGIIFNYNAKNPENERKHRSDVAEQYYTYYQIIRADPNDCTSLKKYNSTNVNQYRPFIHFLCKSSPTTKCDSDDKLPVPKPFKCEKLASMVFDEAQSSYSTETTTTNGWMCFVEIYYDNNAHKNYIRAGELMDFTNHVDCLSHDTINEKFCCSDVFWNPQNGTNCTVEKLLAFNKNAKNNDPSKSGSAKGYFSNCFIRDLPLDSCLSESGCFETRLLEYSKNSDSLEPSGCVDNTEKYIAQDISLASLSLGCRVGENSNRCSVVKSVDGHQRILCCCNGEECKNNAASLPNQIGKKISDFREPK